MEENDVLLTETGQRLVPREGQREDGLRGEENGNGNKEKNYDIKYHEIWTKFLQWVCNVSCLGYLVKSQLLRSDFDRWSSLLKTRCFRE